MSIAWEKAVITDKGFALLTKSMVGAGGEITITSVKAGAGSTPVSELGKQTDVLDIRQVLNLQPMRRSGDTAIIPVYLSNTGRTESYDLRQVGFYAEDPDEGEILYAIAQNSEARHIPTEAEAPGYALVWNFHFSLSNDVSLKVTVNPSGAATNADLEAALNRISELEEQMKQIKGGLDA